VKSLIGQIVEILHERDDDWKLLPVQDGLAGKRGVVKHANREEADVELDCGVLQRFGLDRIRVRKGQL
jgi:hypothetical protein